jgi:hypothetical protein
VLQVHGGQAEKAEQARLVPIKAAIHADVHQVDTYRRTMAETLASPD